MAAKMVPGEDRAEAFLAHGRRPLPIWSGAGRLERWMSGWTGRPAPIGTVGPRKSPGWPGQRGPGLGGRFGLPSGRTGAPTADRCLDDCRRSGRHCGKLGQGQAICGVPGFETFVAEAGIDGRSGAGPMNLITAEAQDPSFCVHVCDLLGVGLRAPGDVISFLTFAAWQRPLGLRLGSSWGPPCPLAGRRAQYILPKVSRAPMPKYFHNFPLPMSCARLYLVGSMAAANAPAIPPPTHESAADLIHVMIFCLSIVSTPSALVWHLCNPWLIRSRRQ
jgi:hypothetical protein